MKKNVILVLMIAVLVCAATSAFAGVWGGDGTGDRPFLNFQAWWDFLVDGLGLPRSG